VEELTKSVVKSVPKEAWAQLTATACQTFEQIIYPLTATTEGIGRLIEAKFKKLEDEEKVIAAKCLQEAHEKVKISKKRHNIKVVIKPVVVFESLKNSSGQTDETIRTLWANLLANEFTRGDVHPEIAKILGLLTSADALLLLEIAKNDEHHLSVKVLKAIAETYGLSGIDKTFSHVHLKKLGLIKDVEKTWYTTVSGKELLKCVSDLD